MKLGQRDQEGRQRFLETCLVLALLAYIIIGVVNGVDEWHEIHAYF
jgi:hypothetical protein